MPERGERGERGARGAGFATRVVQWQASHGRNHLPWQQSRNPYHVWLSEIMLQQTQVATVMGYFARFLQRFPDVQSLASATEDDVMGLWSGLGYYSRARNLHRCAQRVMSEFAGQFPRDALTLQTLPGIGRSTAAAIASLCFVERVAILDANVKRVLTRHAGYAEDLAVATHERGLWDLATSVLPVKAADMPRYTQGMMDLGATVCLPKKPACDQCPVASTCVARAQGDALAYPVRTRKLKRRSQSLWMLWLRAANGDVWLTRRPAQGIWGGLYCFPMFDSDQDLLGAVPKRWHKDIQLGPVVPHVLTHRDLYLHPCVLSLAPPSEAGRGEWGEGRWVPPQEWSDLGLPAPIRKLLLATGSGP